jgi:hypothetical protein
MAARRKKHPVITLFAFQDVIMSVSGVIIVLVLLLSLELIQRPDHNASAAAAQSAVEMRRAIEEADADAAALEQQVREMNARIESSAGLSAAELQRQTNITLADTLQLDAEIAALQARVDSLEETDKQLRAKAFDQQDSRREIESAQRKAAGLKRSLDEERRDNRPLFALPRGFDKTGWIAVLSESEVAVAPLGRASRPQVFAADGGLLGDSAGEKFLAWTRSQQTANLYVLLVIRPDGISSFQEIADGLESRGIDYGFDLAPAGQTLLHPERGAYE